MASPVVEELQRRSTEDIEWFWTAVLNELGIEFYSPYERILDTSRGIAWPRWCCGGKMNIVHNCLDKWKGTPVARRAAIRWEGENGETSCSHLRRTESRGCAVWLMRCERSA